MLDDLVSLEGKEKAGYLEDQEVRVLTVPREPEEHLDNLVYQEEKETEAELVLEENPVEEESQGPRVVPGHQDREETRVIVVRTELLERLETEEAMVAPVRRETLDFPDVQDSLEFVVNQVLPADQEWQGQRETEVKMVVMRWEYLEEKVLLECQGEMAQREAQVCLVETEPPEKEERLVQQVRLDKKETLAYLEELAKTELKVNLVEQSLVDQEMMGLLAKTVPLVSPE